MLKLNTIATFELVPRVTASTDTPGFPYPHMTGNLSRDYLLEGHYVINEETGQKFLRVVVLDGDRRAVCEGRLFRDTTVQGRPQYIGFLRIDEEAGPNATATRSGQIELCAELAPVSQDRRNSRLWGRAYPPQDAAEYAINRVLRESGIAF